MFKVDAGAAIWHAVASESSHRMSLGLAVSDEFAAGILAKLDKLAARSMDEVRSG